LTDTLSKAKRSWNMSRVRNKDTNPEILVRSLLHRSGFRFRLYNTKLPGKPDIVLAKYKTAVFVHGCFWHRHVGCSDATTPKTRTGFWRKKFESNIERDQRAVAALRKLNWNVIVVWECELKNPDNLSEKLRREIKKSPHKATDGEKK
jgi:DNA mismatch endonuclease (patch repair protein)